MKCQKEMEQAQGARDPERAEAWVVAAGVKVVAAGAKVVAAGAKVVVAAGAKVVVLRQARAVIAFALTAVKKQPISWGILVMRSRVLSAERLWHENSKKAFRK